MNLNQRAEQINATGYINATVHPDGYLSLFADYSPNWKPEDMERFLAGAKVKSLKLEVGMLQDSDLLCLSQALEIQDLNLKGNQLVTGRTLSALPRTIGLKSLDVALTQIGDSDLEALTSFPLLSIVWGHRLQFSNNKLSEVSLTHPKLDFRLIY